MQSFVHDKSSSTSHFIKGKSRDLEKLRRYLSGIVIFTFKNDTDGCAGWSACPEDFGVVIIFVVSLQLFLFSTKMIFHLKHYH